MLVNTSDSVCCELQKRGGGGTWCCWTGVLFQYGSTEHLINTPEHFLFVMFLSFVHLWVPLAAIFVLVNLSLSWVMSPSNQILTVFIIPRTECSLMFLLTKIESHSKEIIINYSCSSWSRSGHIKSNHWILHSTPNQNNYSILLNWHQESMKIIKQNHKVHCVLYLHVVMSLQLFNNLFVLCLSFSRRILNKC